jgi:ribose-phosphate pyrophosphokinase
MISFSVDRSNIETQVREWTFPDKAIGVDINIGSLETDLDVKRVWITAKIQSAEDIMALVMATEALRRQYPMAEIGLDMPYIPYARQDRICNNGEAFSLKAFAQIINMLNFKIVQTLDPHSTVADAVFDRVFHRGQIEVFGDVKSFSNCIIVAPDVGAIKKVEAFAKHVGAKGILAFNKTRNLSDGKITGMYPLGEIQEEENYVVLDDICDGGRTFEEVGVFLQYAASVELMVTHGLFTKGVSKLTSIYDRIYTSDSVVHSQEVRQHPRIQIVEM